MAEAVVAALVLAVGLLGTVGVVAGVARDVGRARAADAAGALLAERVAGWRRAPCAADAGERTVGALRERWRVAVVAEFGVLADTVTSAAGRPEPLVGVVAAAGCGP